MKSYSLFVTMLPVINSKYIRCIKKNICIEGIDKKNQAMKVKEILLLLNKNVDLKCKKNDFFHVSNPDRNSAAQCKLIPFILKIEFKSNLISLLDSP